MLTFLGPAKIERDKKPRGAMGVFLCSGCKNQIIRRISLIRIKKQKFCRSCAATDINRRRWMQKNLKRWTKQEDEILLKHGINVDRETLTRFFPDRTLKAIKCRQLHLGIRQPPGKGTARIPGASFRGENFPGPEGWDPSKGPPCLGCKFHGSKTIDSKTNELRRQCSLCDARVHWSVHNMYDPRIDGAAQFLGKNR